jgi:hypothetical protein
MAALRSARIAARSSVQCAERGRSFTPAPMSTWWSAVSARCRSQPAPQETTRSRLQSFSAAVARTNDRKCARARSDSPMSVDWESVRFIAHQCAYLFAQPTHADFCGLAGNKGRCTAFFDTSDCYRPPGLCVCLGELAWMWYSAVPIEDSAPLTTCSACAHRRSCAAQSARAHRRCVAHLFR